MTASAPLYFHARDQAWWRQTLSSLNCDFTLQGLRLLSKSEVEQLFGNSIAMAKRLRAVETNMPRLTAGLGQYGLIDFSKRVSSADSPM